MDKNAKATITETERSEEKKRSVFMFKSSKENEADKYSEALKKADIDSTTIPVLSFRFVNKATLVSHLSSIHLFSAIIFTSERVVESVANALSDSTNSSAVKKTDSYVVGPATALAARKYGFNPLGAETGNAQALAEFIIRHVGSKEQKPLLYPCSNLHRDTLKEVLNGHGILLTEVTSYETCPNPDMNNNLQSAIREKGLPDYAVFFSPSGFQNVLKGADQSMFPLSSTKIIALGPTTRNAICDNGHSVYATTDSPDPAGLLKALS